MRVHLYMIGFKSAAVLAADLRFWVSEIRRAVP